MNLPTSSSETSRGFNRLSEPIQRWIWRKEWETLHEIQERAIQTILDGDNDVIIAAATARGKTEAAFLPLISSVLENPGGTGFDLVYISPLKALINDQFGRLHEMCERIGLPVYPWHGDINQNIKRRAREHPSGILLITPESLEAFFVLRGLEVPGMFKGVRAVVVDELHAFLDTERGIHVRSLLTRVEQSVGHRIRRVGLSATLSDMDLVCKYLRPEDPDSVEVLEDVSSSFWLKAQIRGYLRGSKTENNDSEEDAVRTAVVKHLCKTLRGKRNLIFAGSRTRVEVYADALREHSEKHRWPPEFFPHHGSLSRNHRMDLEERLRIHPATTVVCTSTLELGIDIGEIECVAQIDSPPSVSSLRQRIGRSGRRADVPAILRMYQIEVDPNNQSHRLDRLFLGLIRSIATVELLRQRWCEPPMPQALHLSTLTHQVLSVIAEHGGRSARHIYETLCERGPFRSVSRAMFAQLLRQIGSTEVALLEQAPDGILLLGKVGERIVEHYSFYAVFQTPQEYRIITEHETLGTLPVSTILIPRQTIIFSGRRWEIVEIHEKAKVIRVTADRTGNPPHFKGDQWGNIHDRVITEMRTVLTGKKIPEYLDQTATELLNNARNEFRIHKYDKTLIQTVGERNSLVATWVGSVKSRTLALVLSSNGFSVDRAEGGFLEVSWDLGKPPLMDALIEIANSDSVFPVSVIAKASNLVIEKFHKYLSKELLIEDAASSRLDFESLPGLARKLLEESRE
ncbi:MAG: DEAD/DEAH box helicase [Bacteroidota bacterium]|nr:DEAD/DEAH box helicase [Bacteroidota bacterium]